MPEQRQSPIAPVTEAERRILANLASGEEIDCWDPGSHLAGQLVRGAFLRAVCLGERWSGSSQSGPPKDQAEPETISISNLRLRRAVVLGEIDLSGYGGLQQLAHLEFRNCLITDRINFEDTRLGGFSLVSCTFLGESIDANGAEFHGEVAISEGTMNRRTTLCFDQAHIHRDFSLADVRGTEFAPERISALARLLTTPKTGNDANDAGLDEIHDMVQLTHWIEESDDEADPVTCRQLSLAFVTIGGHMRLSGVTIRPDRKKSSAGAGVALSASQAKISGNLELRESRLYGVVALEFGEISGQIAVTDSLIDCRTAPAQTPMVQARLEGPAQPLPSGPQDPGGVFVRTYCTDSALNLEGVTVGGHFHLLSEQAGCKIYGHLRMLGCHIKGQCLLQGAYVESAPAALQADGAIVDSDFYLGPADDPSFPRTTVIGGLQFPGAIIGGQFGLMGVTIASGNPEVPALSMRDVKIKGGVFIYPRSTRDENEAEKEDCRTYIYGELRLDDADIAGVFEIVDATIKAGTSGLAIRARGMQVKSDVLIGAHNPVRSRLAGPHARCDIEGTMHLAGSTIGGRLLFVGVKANCTTRPIALIASRMTIAGGCFLQAAECLLPSESGAPQTVFQVCEIVGTLRLDNAQVGRRLELVGVNLKHAAELDPTGEEWAESNDYIAIRAAGVQIAGDILFHEGPTRIPCSVEGEIRLIGAEIRGALEIRSGSFSASPQGTGFILDGYNSQISRGAILSGPRPGDAERTLPLITFKGVVGFSYSTLGCFFLGEASAVGVDAVEEKSPVVQLSGNLRLDGAAIKESTILQKVRLTPAFAFHNSDAELAATMLRNINRWDSFDLKTILSAQRSSLGSTLVVDLHSESFGLIDLRGAEAFAMNDQFRDHHPHSPRAHRLGWGHDPTGPGWYGKGEVHGVCINQTGFTYRQFVAAGLTQSKGWGSFVRCSWSWKGPRSFLLDTLKDPRWLLDNRKEQALLRLQWLRQQYPNGKVTKQTFRPGPYIELGRVLRAQGDHHEADYVSIHRRFAQVRYGTHGPLDWLFQRSYGFLFGFGFHTGKALTTLLALVALNLGLAYIGASPSRLWLRQTPKSAAPVYRFEQFLPGAQQSQDAKETKQSLEAREQPEEARPCQTKYIYALDHTLPIRLAEGATCEVSPWAHRWYRWTQTVLLLLSWVLLPAALLTISGILRETNK
jgi:hypothetical protein